MVADAIFCLIGIIGVAGPELSGNFAVIFRSLVFVTDQQADGGARGFALKHAR